MANTLLRLRMQQMFQKEKIPSPRVILTVLKLQGLPNGIIWAQEESLSTGVKLASH